jgi:hypothetical protein
VADEELPLEEAVEQETVPETPPQEEAPQEPSPVETLAMDLGWRPKDQFRGDPEKWKPAEDFIRAGRDIQRSMSQELKEVKDTVTRISSTSQTLLEQQLAERDAFWAAKQKEAEEESDIGAYKQATEARQSLQGSRDGPPPPEIQSFVQRSPWFGYNGNRLATRVAIEVAEEKARQGRPPNEQAEAAEAEVKKRFPELFPAPPKPAPTVAAPTSRSTGSRKGGKTFNDMPPEAQAMARDYLERRGIPLEKYTELFFKDQEKVQ